VTVGPGGGYHAATTQNFTRVGPAGTSTVEARRVAYGSASGIHAAGTAYFHATSAEGRSYTYIDRTGLTASPYASVHAYETHGAATGPLGAVSASAHSRVTVGSGGGYQAATARSFTHVGAGGTTAQASRMAVGTTGGVQAHSTAYYRATSAGEGSYTHVQHTSLTTGPYGSVHAHEVHSAAVGPLGAAGSYHSGGVAVARSGGARAVAVGHSTRYVSGTTLRTRATYVRGAYAGGTFTASWYRVHPAAWRPARWAVASTWAAPAWSAVASFCAVSAPPIQYDYGSSAVIDNGYVYLDGTQVASATDYADQALAVADTGRQAQPAEDEEWQPLGVFGLLQGEEQETQATVQLAVNKAGILRGNYYDALADNNLPVYGAVDLTTQRAAWSVGDKKTLVMEAGLQNLTQDETTALVHYGTTRTRQMALVRLGQPQEEEQ
jgi:hypothetical protein